MAGRWTFEEENFYRAELDRLYTQENKTIAEVAEVLGISQAAVYDRLIRLAIKSEPHKKIRFNNRRTDVVLPEYSDDLAEFVGIMLGDGHISATQVVVTLGTKEQEYTVYVAKLMEKLFGCTATTALTHKGHTVIYIGSTEIVRWLLRMGLVSNKVASQVDVPKWILEKQSFVCAVLRGLYDTDGSVYKIRFGTQVSFTNHSRPLLGAIHAMLLLIGLRPSKIGAKNIYITRRDDLALFLKKVGFANPKHKRRIEEYMRASNSGHFTGL